MENVLLVQEGLIQIIIADQSPSWASLKKVGSLHTKNMAVRCPWSGMPLSRVLVQLSRNMSNQCGNHFFIAPCMLHLCGPLLSGQEAGVALSLRQWKELSTNPWHLYKRTLPTVTSQVTTVIPWRGSGDEREACSSSSCWDWWWNSSCKGRSGGKYLNIHSLMQSTDEVYSVVASGSFAHRKKEMFRK